MFLRALSCWLAILGVLVFSTPLDAQDGSAFLERAIPLAQKSQRETTVPASVTLAQAMWETGRGVSPIGEANNFFGIKAAGASDADVNVGPIANGWVWAWTKEWDGNKYISRRERFRQYANMQDSFRDHGLLLATTPRYADAMRAVDDAREFARRLAAAGYATSPTYAEDLIRLMDAEDLYQYDLPRNDLELVAQSETVQVQRGQIFQIYFDVKNIGFGTWSPSANYYLASTNSNSLSAAAQQPLDQLVPPERVKRWAITMVAPDTAGTFTSRWRMKHGTEDFGPELSVRVEVQAAPALALWYWVGGAVALGALLLGGGIVLAKTRTKKLLHS